VSGIIVVEGEGITVDCFSPGITVGAFFVVARVGSFAPDPGKLITVGFFTVDDGCAQPIMVGFLPPEGMPEELFELSSGTLCPPLVLQQFYEK
jgi:hypothetical protein